MILHLQAVRLRWTLEYRLPNSIALASETEEVERTDVGLRREDGQSQIANPEPCLRSSHCQL